MRTNTLMLFMVLATTTPATASAAGSFALGTEQATVCSDTTLELSTSDAAGGIGFDFDIAYDPNVVSIVEVSLTSLTTDCVAPVFNDFDPNDPLYGTLRIALSCEDPILGTGPFLTITVAPVANGTSALGFDACTVNEAECTATSDGSVTVSCFPTPTPSPIPTPTPTSSIPCTCQGDANKNGFVNFSDYGSVAQNFGQGSTPGGAGDANCNGFVNFADYGAVSQNFGQPCP